MLNQCVIIRFKKFDFIRITSFFSYGNICFYSLRAINEQGIISTTIFLLRNMFLRILYPFYTHFISLSHTFSLNKFSFVSFMSINLEIRRGVDDNFELLYTCKQVY